MSSTLLTPHLRAAISNNTASMRRRITISTMPSCGPTTGAPTPIVLLLCFSLLSIVTDKSCLLHSQDRHKGLNWPIFVSIGHHHEVYQAPSVIPRRRTIYWRTADYAVSKINVDYKRSHSSVQADFIIGINF